METKNDPELLPAAKRIAREYAASEPPMSGQHVPISWRITDDGRLCVVLESGPKLFGSIKGESLLQRGAKAVLQAAEQLFDEDARQKEIDNQQAELDNREFELNRRAIELQAREDTLAEQTSTNLGDGVNDKEASAAGKALQAKKAETKKH